MMHKRHYFSLEQNGGEVKYTSIGNNLVSWMDFKAKAIVWNLKQENLRYEYYVGSPVKDA